MFVLSNQQSAVTAGAAITAGVFTIPAVASMVELRTDAVTGIRYTMDGVTTATTSTGMTMLAADLPKAFDIDTFRNIKAISIVGTGNLLAQFLGARASASYNTITQPGP